MKNSSLYFFLLIGGLFAPLAEVNASMKRLIIKSQFGEDGIHVFCSDGSDQNRIEYIDLDNIDALTYGYKLSHKKYYKSIREFRKQPEYLLNDWGSNKLLKGFTAESGNYCVGRSMSEATKNQFKENYLKYCVYPRKPKKYCFKD